MLTEHDIMLVLHNVYEQTSFKFCKRIIWEKESEWPVLSASDGRKY